MKKGIWILVFMVSLVGMVVFAADFAQPTPNSFVLCDFENWPAIERKSRDFPQAKDQELTIIPNDMVWFIYDDAGQHNSYTVASIVNDAAQGKQALKIKWFLESGGWTGTGFAVPGFPEFKPSNNPIWDWSKAQSITFYIKSVTGKKIKYIIGIADSGNERFRSLGVKLETQGDQWQKVVIPMSKFMARNDWQPNGSKRNTLFDPPGTQIEFVPQSPTGEVIIDYFEINN